jgi:hypothetical protein
MAMMYLGNLQVASSFDKAPETPRITWAGVRVAGEGVGCQGSCKEQQNSATQPWDVFLEFVMSKTYRIFISHSWKYSDAYEKMIQFLDDQNISYFDHSVPQNDPIHTSGSDKDLRNAIEAKIKGCSGVIILAGVYATYSKWINVEVSLSQAYSKKIIAVEPWGSERTSTVVKDAADRIVKWNGKSLADAVRELF